MYQGKYVSNAKPVKPAKQKQPQQPKAPKEKKRVTVGTIIFYFLYFMAIAAFVFGVHYGLGLLNDWLVRYEASQPDTRSQEIFEELFADPDWGEIYTLAGLENTSYEGKDAYVAYMEQKIGGQELTYAKTSAGLTGGRKYIIRLGEEKIAAFTMQNSVTGELEIPQWELDSVEVTVFSRDESVIIHTRPDRSVTVNGIALDDSHIIKTTSTNVESYLPEGVHGPRTATFYADGFLIAPEVAVIDAEGNAVEVTYDAETKTYTEADLSAAPAEISDEEYNALVDATKSYCKHMIGATGARLSSHFDTSSQIYKTITKNELWFKGYASYDFSEETITEYRRYTEDLFSARIQITLNTYRNDGSVKPFEINTTMFLTLDEDKGWIVSNMTNVDLHEETTLVRLTWMLDGETLSSEMVDAAEKQLLPPAVTAPEGKVFSGWFLESTDENGDTVYSLVFAPDAESGTVSLPDDYTLEPMVLQALFEDQGE